jgi:hypothetical protein
LPSENSATEAKTGPEPYAMPASGCVLGMDSLRCTSGHGTDPPVIAERHTTEGSDLGRDLEEASLFLNDLGDILYVERKLVDERGSRRG